jgi:hypothetical protein
LFNPKWAIVHGAYKLHFDDIIMHAFKTKDWLARNRNNVSKVEQFLFFLQTVVSVCLHYGKFQLSMLILSTKHALLYHQNVTCTRREQLLISGWTIRFFPKKIFWFPMLLKKIFWFWWRKKKKCDSEFLSYNLMLNCGKKIRALRDKINKYSNFCVVRKTISDRNKKP